ncbi:endonuclease domain-containing protein [bacterium]|nr:MAG: endonuclease domain-containing protein [bacterium]
MSSIIENAKYLRQNSTKAEDVLWDEIRNKKLDIKFRRQVPLDIGGCNFIPDFCCIKEKLIIEVDGDIHDNEENKEYDKIREDILKENGYKIIRFRNEEIINSIEDVLEKTRKSIKSIS